MRWSPVQRSSTVCTCVCVCVSALPRARIIVYLLTFNRRGLGPSWVVAPHLFDLVYLTTPVSLYYIFPQYLINVTIFGKTLLDIKRVFWFSLKLLSETFLILRRTERDILINVHKHSCKIPFISLRIEWDLNFLDRFWEKNKNKNQIIWKSVQLEPNCPMRTDQQTGMTKLKVTFRNFSKATTKCQNKQYPGQD
jgi:hypothetical protein